MINKRIFYMWCGSQKPADVNMCILSWKKALPDYELIEISEKSNKWFNFEEQCQQNDFFNYVYKNKIWAYVADYVRFYVLEKFGGIWLDTDVSVIKDFSEYLHNGVFLGREKEYTENVETAVIGAVAHHPLIKKTLDFYSEQIWQSSIYTSPRIISLMLKDYGYLGEQSSQGILQLKNDITIYPPEHFFPLPVVGEFSEDMVTEKSVCVHWWKNSWGRPDVIEWLKNKHKIGKEKSLKVALRQYNKLYLFGFIPFGKYIKEKSLITVLGLPILKIKRAPKKSKVNLFGIIPLLKWR